eukprot:4000691-Alexandrium_andersonii.AAC.1
MCIRDSKRGFVKGRLVSDNVVQLDGFAAAAAYTAPRPAISLWDFEAAFPSLRWGWIWHALSAAGVPPRI